MNQPMWWVILILMLLVTAGLALHVTVKIVRAGSREEYLSGFPIFNALFYTFGLALLFVGLDWLTGKANPTPPRLWLLIAGVLFLYGCSLWLAGFAFGRWRRPKREGIIRR